MKTPCVDFASAPVIADGESKLFGFEPKKKKNELRFKEKTNHISNDFKLSAFAHKSNQSKPSMMKELNSSTENVKCILILLRI